MAENIIWTNGCFDVLHRGHIELFKYAKSLGGKLFVGIDSDKKVQKDKGLRRPINSEEDRKAMLECIKFVDQVFVFNSQQGLEDLIKYIKPDSMVIGSDWRGKKVVGEQYTKKLVFFDRIEGYSTTNILERKYNYDS
jgi:rfaE bifunctional protein nucleotidyltransferase chain/domain